jgi:UDP-N-acetylglucosamine/UDP-N-acetylgalactosamine 4-epimerase
MLKHKKILVTGGAGFIGSNLCEYFLKQDNEVICLDNFITGKRENITNFIRLKNFSLIEGDIRNPKDCATAAKDVDYVFHQAALGSVPRSIENPEPTNDINISGFLNMLIAGRDAKIKRFIYASSSSVYGDNPTLPKVETNIGKPLSPYAVTKQVNELYAKVFADLYGMEVVGLRYFNVFGQRQDPDGAYAAAIPKFIRLLLKGETPVIYGNGEQSRDFTYISNVVHANECAAFTENPNALNTVFNIAYGSRISLNDLYSLLTENLSKFKNEIKNIKPNYVSERKGDIKDSLASIEKAKTILGYRPDCDVKAGLERSIDWYVKNLR